MKRVNRIIFFILLVMGLISITGCRAAGAAISLQGVSLGTVAMERQPISGLPSDKVDLLFEVAAQTVQVSLSTDNSNAGVTTLTLLPSGATIEIRAGGVSLKGFKPEQVKVQWATSSKSD